MALHRLQLGLSEECLSFSEKLGAPGPCPQTASLRAHLAALPESRALLGFPSTGG